MPDIQKVSGQSHDNHNNSDLRSSVASYLMRVRTRELERYGPRHGLPPYRSKDAAGDPDILAKTTFNGAHNEDPSKDLHYHEACVLPGILELNESPIENPRIDMSANNKLVLWYALAGLIHSGFEVKITEFIETNPESEEMGCLQYLLSPHYPEDDPSVDSTIQPGPDLFSGVFGTPDKHKTPLKLLTLKQEANALVNAARIIDAVNQRIADAFIQSRDEDTPVLVEFEVTDRTDDLGADTLHLSEQDYLTFEIVLAHLLKGGPKSRNFSDQELTAKSDSEIILDRCNMRLVPGAIITHSRERPTYQIRVIFEQNPDPSNS